MPEPVAYKEPIRPRYEVSEEDRVNLLQDIGRLTLIGNALKDRMHEYSPSKFRKIAKFIFMPWKWEHDQHMANRYGTELFHVEHMKLNAESAIEGNLSVDFYKGVLDVIGIEFIHDHAFNYGRTSPDLYEASRIEPNFQQVQ